MKFFRRLGLYKSSNVSFDPSRFEAKSYNWWIFVRRVYGKLVFNDFRYSVSTANHQNKVRRLLTELGVNIDIVIECPQGLQHLKSSIEFYKGKIEGLQEQICKPRSRKSANEQRRRTITLSEQKIKDVMALVKGERRKAA